MSNAGELLSADRILSGFASLGASGTQTLLTVPANRTWVGMVGMEATIGVPAGGAAATLQGFIETVGGSRVIELDLNIPAVPAAVTPVALADAVTGQRLVVVAGNAPVVVRLNVSIVNGAGAAIAAWANGELT